MENKEIIKASMFRQKVFAKRYYCLVMCGNRWGYNKVSAINIQAAAEQNFLEDSEFFNCDLEMPLLEIGDHFFIEELNELVYIKSRYRTSSNKVVYYIDDKYIEDDKTRETVSGKIKYTNSGQME